MAIEDEFGIEIPNEDLETLFIVGHACDYIARNLRKRGEAPNEGQLWERLTRIVAARFRVRAEDVTRTSRVVYVTSRFRLGRARSRLRLIEGYSKKKYWPKFALGGSLALLFGAVLYVSLRMNGTIPSIADTEDVSYGKLLGIPPSSGEVWQHTSGFGSGIAYYRLHLTSADFDKFFASADKCEFRRLNNAPSWWNPPTVSQCFRSGGLGSGTENLYFYDPKRQMLFARCEWD